jgi:hypothetical protein
MQECFAGQLGRLEHSIADQGLDFPVHTLVNIRTLPEQAHSAVPHSQRPLTRPVVFCKEFVEKHTF